MVKKHLPPKSPEIRIIHEGLHRTYFRDLYYWVLKKPWSYFLFGSAFLYLSLNGLFAALILLEPGNIANARPGSYWDAFVFIFQTSATIGYGHYLPQTTYAHIIVIADAIASMLYVALNTGLAFAKFSRPSARVIFSHQALIAPYDGVPTLMFRMGNGRSTQIVDASIEVVALKPYTSLEGHSMRRFMPIQLERNHSPVFALTWLVFHKIDEKSPLYGLKAEDLEREQIELFVSFKGIDDVFAQTVHASYRYTAKEIIFGRKYVDIVDVLPDGYRKIHFDRFHDIEI